MAGWLSAIFAVSGASALAFETLWFHQAGLALGNSVWASSLVLAGFMAGLGLGNVMAARWGDQVARPVRLFAGLEAIVAVSGVALVVTLPAAAPVLAPALGSLAELPWAINATRLLVAFALLLVPATAMGVTLPLLTRALAASGADFGPALGRLYGWNTLGAVAGAALAEGWLIGTLGIRGTALAAGAGNLLAAAAALTLASRIPSPPSSETSSLAERGEPAGPAAPWRAAVFLSGFALLALEVVWFRFLSLFVVAHAEAFAWMLCTVLAGIGLGGLAAGRWLRAAPEARQHAPLVGFAAGAVCVASYAAFPLALDRAGAGVLDAAPDILALCVPLMLPVALLSGAFFALVGAGLRATASGDARAAGTLTFANTLGAALGALAAGFLMLPNLGMERSLLVLAATLGAAGFVLLPRTAARRSAVAGLAIWLVALLAFPHGSMETRYFARALAGYEQNEDTTLHVREGVNETILWLENRFLGQPYTHRMVTNSFSMSATDVQARRYMKLYAYWPVALHPALREALLISYGVGSTAKALVDSPGLERLDVVELSPDVLAMSDIPFPDPATAPLQDPRVRVHVEDGRYFLETTDRRFDLITAEPPPPQMAGVANLYTREYFSRVRKRLADGGMATYWLPLRALSDQSALAIVGAFCAAFEDCSLWRGMSFELMLVGTNGARGPVERDHFERQWLDPKVRPELLALGFERPEQLGALFIAGADDLRRVTAEVPALDDDHPKRITAPPSSMEAMHRLYADWLDPRLGRARFARSEVVRRLWPPALIPATLPFFELQHLLDTFGQDIRSDLWSERLTDLHGVLTETSARTPVLWLLGSDADAQLIVAEAADAERARPIAALHVAAGHFADRDYAGAASALVVAQQEDAKAERAVALRLFALAMDGRTEQAREEAWRNADAIPAVRARDYWGFMNDRFGVVPTSPGGGR